MIRGTTPTHVFTLPFDTVMVKTIKITYRQNCIVKLTKRNDDCIFDGNTVTIKLTQDDTLAFMGGTCVEIGIRVLTLNGEAFASNIMRVRCSECLGDDEVLV